MIIFGFVLLIVVGVLVIAGALTAGYGRIRPQDDEITHDDADGGEQTPAQMALEYRCPHGVRILTDGGRCAIACECLHRCDEHSAYDTRQCCHSPLECECCAFTERRAGGIAYDVNSEQVGGSDEYRGTHGVL